MTDLLINDNEYLEVVKTITAEIKGAQYKAVVGVNRELTLLYYNIGKVINAHKIWGNKFITNLATDIKLSFPGSTGYSVRNLKHMAKFAETYPDAEFVQTVSAQIPWSHNITIAEKLKDMERRAWYIEKTVINGWSHAVLVHQIESGLYERQALAELVAEYALKDMSKPIGVSEYKLTASLPDELIRELPSIEDIQNRIT